MKEDPKKKECPFCKEYFTPHPKVGDNQYACRKNPCQQERKKLSQERWLSKNPNYFKGRYPQLKENILRNKRQRRSKKQEQLSLRESGIQDELTSFNNKILEMVKKAMSIQDELSYKISISKQQLRNALDLGYKTS
jgi:hypothetical protein